MGAEAKVGVNHTLHDISTKFLKELIEYDNLDFEKMAALYSGVLAEYDSMIARMKTIESYGLSYFEGEAADTINACLEILARYLNDYRHTLVDLEGTIDNLKTMAQEIADLEVIQEIRNT